MMSAIKRKFRLPLFWVNLLIDVGTASIVILCASLADEVVIVGYEGKEAVLILSAVAFVVVGLTTLLGLIRRPFNVSLRDYFCERDW
jgi:hypothetical protein